MTLQKLLETTVKGKNVDGNEIDFVPEFRVAVQGSKGDGVHFIIHPSGHNGETLDFVVTGNELRFL